MTHRLPAIALPSVSVIVPAYNRAEWIPVTVRSALAQTHAPLEIIVVDDGSKDDAEGATSGLGASVRYVRKSNGGVSSARNLGARLARGEYVAFVDADDVWAPRKLELQLRAILATGAEWSVTDFEVIALDGAPIPARAGFRGVFPLFRELGLEPEAFLGAWLAQAPLEAEGPVRVFSGDAYGALFHGNFVLPSSSLVRRERFLAVGGFDERFRLAEETEFFHRLAAAAPVAVVLEPLVGYRVGQSGGLTSPANTSVLVRNALQSLEQATALRPALSERERGAYEVGRRRLLLALAYSRLAALDGAGAREALRGAWAAGAARSPRGLAYYVAATLPAWALRALHMTKRGARALGARLGQAR